VLGKPTLSNMLNISWKKIHKEFGDRYDRIFMNHAAKLHLDIADCVIDGAKSGWKDVLLLDCILCNAIGTRF